MWYNSLIHDALKVGIPVHLFIGEQGELGVKIGDIELPYFAWESFEEQPGDYYAQKCPEQDEEIHRVQQVIGLITDVKLSQNLKCSNCGGIHKYFEDWLNCGSKEKQSVLER